MPTSAAMPPDPIELHMLAILGDLIANKADAARVTGISRPQLSQLLSGQKPARFSELQRLCDYVGQSFTDVLIQAEMAAEQDAETDAGGSR